MNNVKILIVEDEIIIALSMKQELEKRGYLVIDISMSGDHAIEMTKKHYPHIILMDYKLQGNKDGIETAVIIHNMVQIPIIFITGNSDKQTLEKIEQLPLVELMNKPVDYNNLDITIKRSLSII